MKRTLTGSLRHLAPPTLLRPLAATSPTGVLVGDCSGDQLPDLRELSLLARRLGGLLVQA